MQESIDALKSTIITKDATIEELKSRTGRPGGTVTGLGDDIDINDLRAGDVSILTQALKEREEQIDELHHKLKQATQ